MSGSCHSREIQVLASVVGAIGYAPLVENARLTRRLDGLIHTDPDHP